MLALVVSVVTRLVAYVARPIIGLRYRIDLRGLDAVKRKGRRGILFLPNHSSLLDPAFIVAHLYPAFQLRPLADEHQVNRTMFGYIALLYGSRILPNLERSGAGASDRTRAALQEIAGGLKAGENILLYPAGRLKRQYLEDIGSASGVETLVKAVPDVRIVLVRHNGLWGSSFSLGFDGEMPAIGSALARGVKYLLLNGIFFMPRRRMSVELVEPDDFPRTGTRAEINRYLERFYNERAARNTYVPYGFWEKGGTREMPEPVREAPRSDASHVAPATRDLVLAHLRDESGRTEVSIDDQLSKDLGFDSLATAELVTWLQQEFGFSVDTPESLTDRRRRGPGGGRAGCVPHGLGSEGAAGLVVRRVGQPDGPGAAAGRHADRRVPEAGRRPASPTDLRRPVERHAHLSRPGHRRARAQAESSNGCRARTSAS